MTIDVFPPTTATQTDWVRVIQDDAPRTATAPPEQTVVRVHLRGGEILVIPIPDRPGRR